MNIAFTYSLKIWLTTIVTAPVFLILINFYGDSRSAEEVANSILGVYIWIVVVGFFGSFLTLAVFTTGVYNILNSDIIQTGRKAAIQLFGVLITVSTILFYAAMLDSFSALYTKTFWMFVGPYIICLAASIQFYQLPQLYTNRQQNSTT